MKNHKLIRLFKTLNQQELRELKQFVRSPFYNRRQDVIRLFDTLRKIIKYPEKLTAEKLFVKVYPEQFFHASNLAHVMSYLLKIIEEYLIQQEVNREGKERYFYLIRAYRRRNLNKALQRKIIQAEVLLRQQNTKNLQTHYDYYRLGMEIYNVQKRQKRTVVTALQETANYLDLYLIGKKLHQSCILLTHSALSSQQYELGLLKNILNYLEMPAQKALLNEPSLVLWYHALQTFLAPNKEQHFQKLKHFLPQTSQYFSQAECSDFYQIALNFCIKRLNQGQQIYIQEAFNLYKRGLAIDIFFEDDYLSPFTYKNIIALGLGLKEYKWVKQFIHDYKKKLPPQHREQSFKYNLARWHFEQQNYKDALMLLQVVTFQDVLPKLTAKVLQSKIYFELGEIEVLYHFLRSFEHQLRRQKKLGYHKTYYLNFVRMTQKLAQINKTDKKEVENLRKQIEEMEQLPEKGWLLRCCQ